MEQEMIQVPRKKFEELLEEVGIVRNPDMMEAIKESKEAEAKGVKGWEIDY